MKRLTVIAIVIFTSAISFSEAAEILNFLVNGVKTEPGRYPTYVSLRDKNNTDSSKSGSGTGSGTGTGNGSGSSSGSSASSPPRSSSSSTNSTKPLTHFCGASLISDWLVLTSAHCVPNNQAAQPSNFRAAGLNFTSLPNAYVPSVRYDDQVTAFIGADRLDLGDAAGNPIQLWFVHPWFDINTYQYDVAIGMLTTPNRTAPKANLGISSTDIYNIFNNSTELYAIGLGNRLSAQQSKVLAALSNNYVDPNNDPEEELEEVLLGTLTPRVTCGIALTNYSVDTYTNGNGNVEYPYLYSTASIISNGQFCLQPRDPNSVPPVVGQSSGQGSDISVLKLYNDTCQGDSGGPVFKKGANSSSDLVVGLVSWGYGCGLGLPSVYANLGAFMNSTQFDNYLSFVMSKIPNSLNGTATRGGPAPASSVAALAPTATVAVRSTQGSLQEANGSLGKAPASSVTVTAASPKGSSVG